MDTLRKFSGRTYRVDIRAGRSILFTLFFIALYIVLLEAFLRIVPIPAFLFIPSIDRKLNYPEIDIKLSRLDTLARSQAVNCLITGSSMADFALTPSIFNQNTIQMGGNKPLCFNMAMKAMKPEEQSKIIPILVDQYKPVVLIIGISPVDFTGGQDAIREFGSAPWIRYKEGGQSAEGWWIEHSTVYRYWLAFLKYRDPAYRADMNKQLAAIDAYGSQKEEKSGFVYQYQSRPFIPDFQFNPGDWNGLVRMVGLRSPALQVVVVEMPVHPDFLPDYVPGGEAGYDQNFIQPIQLILRENDIPFIRTQPQIRSIVSPCGWKDFLHLNRLGAEQFSRWLAKVLVE